MICPNCQFENFATSSSCSSCGKPFRLVRNGSVPSPQTETIQKPKTKAVQKSKPKSKVKSAPQIAVKPLPPASIEKPVFIPEPINLVFKLANVKSTIVKMQCQ